ncbi:hypothetical protein W97_05734 [Coniosporium apollinis CBS 100218]|uniref:Urease accessory protein n=1 Tax=Coniosporium apollinis (strain CBS 100218) TaxID=1168221 RepID=R7YXF6_CONA1|nr:uncharacterized protein W97_05734 [Coniosporium apollinis CBS 100218]EON66489.1 hypothetical protein W97_05734 [Coniosporium apollinis CBS 100218]
MITPDPNQQSLQDEIIALERRLLEAKSRLNVNGVDRPLSLTESSNGALHTLLLLADSALPLGSFAFSSGLESYLAHHRPSPPSASQVPSFHRFLHLSLSSLASTALPYTLAAYRHPELINDLDNDFDASTPCTVARRASVAQGRALLSVWDRSFKSHYASSALSNNSNVEIDASIAFQDLLRNPPPGPPESQPNAHLAPLWGLLTRILGLPLHESAYLFLFSHVRTVTSAAVRASVLGPYQAQAVLASGELREKIQALVGEMWDVKVEDAGLSVPVMDLWVGRHEMLYSRIFNS